MNPSSPILLIQYYVISKFVPVWTQTGTQLNMCVCVCVRERERHTGKTWL
jgi:hypothetical protein